MTSAKEGSRNSGFRLSTQYSRVRSPRLTCAQEGGWLGRRGDERAVRAGKQGGKSHASTRADELGVAHLQARRMAHRHTLSLAVAVRSGTVPHEQRGSWAGLIVHCLSTNLDIDERARFLNQVQIHL